MKTSFIRFILLFLIAWGIPSLVASQKNYIVTQYSTQDGLPQKTINAIQQDHKGNMWFATWNGISRFDGYSFTNYRAHPSDSIDLTNNRFNFLKENIDGYFWIQNYDKYIYRFNPQNGTFQQIPNNDNYKAQRINILSNGDVWAHMENGDMYRIYSLNKKQIKVQKITHISSSIKTIFIYRKENVWILTENELLQYELSSNKLTCHLLGNEKDHFYCLRKYPNCYLIGSDKGYLYNYDIEKNCYTKDKLPTNSNIRNIKAFSPTQILLITATDGFFIYNFKDKTSVHYSAQTTGLINNSVKSLYVDPDKNIWLTYNNLLSNVSYIKTKTNKISHYTLKDKNGKSINQCRSIHIFEDVNNYLLFHSSGNILNYYDKGKDELKPFILSENPEIISFNEPTNVYLDRQKNMWLGKLNRGIIKVSFKKNLFKLTSPNSDDIYSPENELRTVFEDKNNNLWVSSQEGTIQLYNHKKEFIGFLSSSGQISTQKVYAGTAYSVIQDREGIIWIGTKNKGIIKLTPNEKCSYHTEYFSFDPNNPYSLNCNQVYSLHEDSSGRIWVGTFEKGLNYIDKDSKGNIIFINSNNELKQYPSTGNKIRCIQSDGQGNLWIGTTSGIVQCGYQFSQPNQIKFQTIARVAGDASSLSNNDIYHIYLARNNQLYFATFGGGLCKLQSFQNKNAIFKHYSKANGLSSDVLQTIQEDSKGYLWIATEEGLCRFSSQQETFESYDSRFFPSDIQFTESNAIQTSNNELIFNTDRGFLSFNPENIKRDSYKPQIIFNHLFIREHEIIAGKSPLLETSINETSNLILSHSNNSFSINYVALDMKYPNKIQYAYRLKGFDNWNYVGDDRTATYTNIPKGTYTFQVKSTNSDGLWVKNEKAILITINPSFWESIWGILLLISLFIIILLFTTYIFLLFYKLKSKVIFEQRLSDVKTKFFTDIVHELRTPFTLIIAPLEHILSTKGIPEIIHQDLKLMQHNTQRTVKLINQILDFQKIQNNKMKLRVQHIELYSFIKHIIDSFESLTLSQDTEIELSTISKEVYSWIDADKIEIVLFNLISNAIKYSPKGKKILIHISEEKEYITLSVSDQGFGIAPEKQKLIFARFENLVHNQILKQPSTGIGLSLVKEMVELHKGEIELQSRINEGTTFKIKLRKGKEHFEKETEFILTDYQFDDNYEKTFLDESLNETMDAKRDLSTILLVEDNNELRYFLQTILAEFFQVITAKNGEEGLNKAVQFNPDMIISDVMMPIMNGIEMVKGIRANISICHIPIILLTSKSTVESQIEGFELGIDDYVTKPFSANYLKARIFNLLEQRKRLQTLYCSQLMTSEKEKEEINNEIDTNKLTLLSPYDKELVEKIVKHIKENIEDTTLSVESIAQEIGLSRSTLFKKIKTLTGLAPIELIKSIRIQQAVALIEEGKQNLTQIAYTTGFNDSHYFSKCFKQMYGMTPSEYKKNYFQK